MPLTEDQAFDLSEQLGNLKPADQSTATYHLDLYRKQQEENGMPLFPNRFKEQMDGQRDFQSMFKDLSNVDRLHPNLGQSLAIAQDPEKDRMKVANVKFISRYTGKTEDEVWDGYDAMMPAFAAQVWGRDVKDDKAFYAGAAGQVQGEMKMEQATDDAQANALVAAANPAMTGNAALSAWKDANPDATDDQLCNFLSQYNAVADVLTGHGALIKKLEPALTGGAVDPETINQLTELPPKTRNLLVASMFAQAKLKGDAAGADGTESVAGGAVYFGSQTGKALARTIKDMYGGEAYLNAAYTMAVDKLTTTTAPEGATAKEIEAAAIGSLQTRTAGAEGGYTSPVGKERPLTKEEKTALKKQVEQTKKGFKLADQIEQISQTADPVKMAMASGLGSSVALMSVIALPGGSALSTVGYANSEYKKLTREHPEIPENARYGVSLVSASAMAATDAFEFSFLKGSLPSLRNLVSNGAATSVLARGIIRGAEVTAFENIQEGVQDITTAVVQDMAAALSKDLPDVNWDAEWSQWYAERPDVAIGALPLTMLGLGVSTVQDMRGAKAMLSDNAMLQKAGVLPADRITVVDLAVKGDLQGAQAALAGSIHQTLCR